MRHRTRLDRQDHRERENRALCGSGGMDAGGIFAATRTNETRLETRSAGPHQSADPDLPQRGVTKLAEWRRQGAGRPCTHVYANNAKAQRAHNNLSTLLCGTTFGRGINSQRLFYCKLPRRAGLYGPCYGRCPRMPPPADEPLGRAAPASNMDYSRHGGRDAPGERDASSRGSGEEEGEPAKLRWLSLLLPPESLRKCGPTEPQDRLRGCLL